MTKLEAWVQAADLVAPIIEKFPIEKKSGASNIFGNSGVITPVEQYIDHVIFVAEWLLEAEEEKEEPLPLLGMATTHDLIHELKTRMEITQDTFNGRTFGTHCTRALNELDEEVLNYRTYDS